MIPLLEKVYWFLGFVVSWCLVSWCVGFLVSNVLGLLVTKCLGFLVSNCKVSRIYQMIISCLLEEIGPTFKIVENLLDGSSVRYVSAPVVSNIYKMLDFQKGESCTHNMSQK